MLVNLSSNISCLYKKKNSQSNVCQDANEWKRYGLRVASVVLCDDRTTTLASQNRRGNSPRIENNDQFDIVNVRS